MTARRLSGAAAAALIACSVVIPPSAAADPLANCQQTADTDLAIDGCTALIDSGRNVAAVYYARGLAYYNKRDWYHASQDFAEAIHLGDDHDHAVYLNLGLANVSLAADDPKFAEDAIDDLNKALELKPDIDAKSQVDFAQAFVTRASTKLADGQDADARRDEERALALNADKSTRIKAIFAGAYQKRALKELAAGQYEQSASDLQQAIGLNRTTSDELTPYLTEAQTDKPGPYAALAEGKQRATDGDAELAAQSYSKAIQANPKLAAAYLDRALAYQDLNRLPDALADFNQAIKLGSSNAQAYYYRAEFYQSIDQFDAEQADLDQASRLAQADAGPFGEDERSQIDAALKTLQFERKLNGRWISYLKDIQADNNYENWSAPPYDLYLQNHKMPQVAPPPAPPAAPPPPPKPAPADYSTYEIAAVGLLLIAAVAGIAIALLRRRGKNLPEPSEPEW